MEKILPHTHTKSKATHFVAQCGTQRHVFMCLSAYVHEHVGARETHYRDCFPNQLQQHKERYFDIEEQKYNYIKVTKDTVPPYMYAYIATVWPQRASKQRNISQRGSLCGHNLLHLFFNTFCLPLILIFLNVSNLFVSSAFPNTFLLQLHIMPRLSPMPSQRCHKVSQVSCVLTGAPLFPNSSQGLLYCHENT